MSRPFRPLALAGALALAVTLALTACGGGDGAAPVDTAVRAATPLEVMTSLRDQSLSLASASLVDPAEAARQLMDFAETQFPQYFPAHAATQSAAPFAYRYYPATGIHLGVVLTSGTEYVDQGVYVMGGAFGDAPAMVGRVGDFISPVDPRLGLTLANDKAVVLQGANTAVMLDLSRQAGFTGAVQVTVSGLPAGVSAAALTVPASARTAQLMLSAQVGAPHSLPTGATVTASSGDVVVSRPLSVTVRGVPGAIDTSFGGGVIVTPVDISEDYANAAAVQADGKVIVAGSSATLNGTQFSLVRYQRDGGLDPSFGEGGKVILRMGPKGNDVASALAVQADGRIVVAGRSEQEGSRLDVAVARLLPDGRLDTSFANGGRFTLDFAGDTDRAWALAIQADGRIIVGGESSHDHDMFFTLIRLTAAGSLDPTFGQGGKVVQALRSNAGGSVRGLALPTVDGEQRILAVGGEGDFQMARFRASGALDGSFGQGGQVTGLFNSNIGSASAVTLLPGGQAVIAGHIGHRFAAVQLTATGQLDAQFGSAGKFVHAVVDNWNEAQAVVRQADGKLVLGGWAYSGNGSSGDFAAIRLTAAGQLDSGFAQAGVLITPTAVGTKDDQSHALVLQADERVPSVRAIQAGEANGSNHDFTVLRLWL